MLGSIHPEIIYIFYGKMGSGKTTNAVKQLLDFRSAGKTCWVNFPIKEVPVWKNKKKVEPNVWFEDDPSGILSMRDGLYVIDEAYMVLNSREWANLSKAVFTAFTHTRKLNMTVIVIAQSWMRIDKSIREVATVARQFEGASVFGRLYRYTDYLIDEMGEIIKTEPVEYRTADKGLSVVRKRVYDAFDTDYLFSKEPPPREWRSAIGLNPLAPAAAAGAVTSDLTEKRSVRHGATGPSGAMAA